MAPKLGLAPGWGLGRWVTLLPSAALSVLGGVVAALQEEQECSEFGRGGRTAVRNSWEGIYMQAQGLGKASSLS